VGTRGVWAAACGLGTPPAPIWRLGLAFVLGTPLRTRGVLLPAWGLGTP